MIHALSASLVAALLLACVVRATRPGNLLAFLAPAWQWWLVYRPGWLPDKPSGGCAFCMAFWLPGIPVAVAVALLTPGQVCLWETPLNLWACAVPFMVAMASEITIHA